MLMTCSLFLTFGGGDHLTSGCCLSCRRIDRMRPTSLTFLLAFGLKSHDLVTRSQLISELPEAEELPVACNSASIALRKPRTPRLVFNYFLDKKILSTRLLVSNSVNM